MSVLEQDPGTPVVEGENPGVATPEKPAPYDLLKQHDYSVKDFLPDPLKGEKVFENVPDFPTLFKNYAEAQKYIGGAVRVPGADSPPEEWDKFYSKLGRPESAEGYQVAPPKVDGVDWDNAGLGGLYKTAHALGLNQRQVQGIVNYYGEYLGGQIGQVGAQAKESEKTLREEWGGAYDRNLALAQRTIKTFGGDEAFQKLAAHPLGNDPTFVKMLARVGRELAEDGSLPDSSTALGDEDAKSKINAIMGDPKSPYRDTSHPGHDEAVREMERLHQIAYGAV